jgi:hypothetical protein
MPRPQQPDSYRTVAAYFGVPVSTLEKWTKQCRIDLSDRIAVGLMLRRKSLSPEVRRSVEAGLNTLGVSTPEMILARFPR